MLYNFLWFSFGVVFMFTISVAQKRRDQNIELETSGAAFETKNSIIKATLLSGNVYFTTIYDAGLNRWWKQDKNQKRGKLEQNLTHQYSVAEMKKLFLNPTEKEKPTTLPKKENKLN